MHFAAYCGAVESVKKIIAKDSTVADQRDEVNKGIMHHAAVSGSLPLVQLLTQQLSLDMIQIDNYGNLCIHCAADAGQPQILQWLLAYVAMHCGQFCFTLPLSCVFHGLNNPFAVCGFVHRYQIKKVQLIYSAWSFEDDCAKVFRDFISSRKNEHVPQTFERPWLLDCIRAYIKSMTPEQRKYVSSIQWLQMIDSPADELITSCDSTCLRLTVLHCYCGAKVPTPQQTILDLVVQEKDSTPQSEHISVSTFLDITRYILPGIVMAFLTFMVTTYKQEPLQACSRVSGSPSHKQSLRLTHSYQQVYYLLQLCESPQQPRSHVYSHLFQPDCNGYH